MGIALQEFKLDYNSYPARLNPADRSENRYWKQALGYEMNVYSNVQYIPREYGIVPQRLGPQAPIGKVTKSGVGTNMDITPVDLVSLMSSNSLRSF